MDQITELLTSKDFIPYFLFIVMGVIAIVGIVFGCAVSMVKARAREASRRDIAAFIAEGSMTPADGERLMAAGEDAKD